MANTTGYDAGVQVSRRPSPAQQQTSSYSHKYQFYLQYPPPAASQLLKTTHQLLLSTR